MEKAKKGLFGSLLDFWMEKVSIGKPNSIGFWNETETVENHFAEMGAVASLTQEETKRSFWKETAETIQEETERRILFAEEPERKKPDEEEEFFDGERDVSKMFTAEVFRNGRRETEETEENGFGTAFVWEMPEEEKVERNIIPVAEEPEEKEETVMETAQGVQVKEIPKREEKQTEQQIDIEKLMRQMTKKLWEERESCGRRLR